MRATLKKGKRPVGYVLVSEDGALTLNLGGQTVSLSPQASRRIAGEVVKRSVEHTAEKVRTGVAEAAKAEIDRIFAPSFAAMSQPEDDE